MKLKYTSDSQTWVHINIIWRFIKTQVAGFHPQSFWLNTSGVRLKMCISNKFPSDNTDNAGTVAIHWDTLG
jgi:hypothetical protein